MVIYADILVILNVIVDYFLISVTGKILKFKEKVIKYLVASLIGGLSSFYIFLPVNFFVIDIFFKILVCFLMSFSAWKYINFKTLLKSSIVLFGITLLYGGIMFFIYKTFTPKSMAVINSVVYFNISPLVLIGLTLLFYFLFCVFSVIFKRNCETAIRCNVTVCIDKKEISLNAICDSGNSLKDVFGKSEIIITDSKILKKYFGISNLKEDNLYTFRYRAIPCTTVVGTEILDGLRCDKGSVICDKKILYLEKPILAISKTDFTEEYNAIINPHILE